MPCGVYAICNEVDGRCYYGSSINMNKRLSVHKSSLRGGYHCNAHLQRAWNKYGEDAFSFNSVEVTDESSLDERESFWIKNNKSYNFSLPTKRNGHYHNEEFRRKQSSKPIMGVTPDGDSLYFDTLWDAAEYIIENKLSKGQHHVVRMEISNSARGVVVNAGRGYKAVRKTAYKHQWLFI